MRKTSLLLGISAVLFGLGLSTAKADTIFWLQDGGYTADQVKVYWCLMDACYDINTGQAAPSAVNLTPTSTPVVLPQVFIQPVVPVTVVPAQPVEPVPPVEPVVPVQEPVKQAPVVPDCVYNMDSVNTQVNAWVAAMDSERSQFPEDNSSDAPYQQITRKYNGLINKLIGQYQTERTQNWGGTGGCLVNGVPGVIGQN